MKGRPDSLTERKGVPVLCLSQFALTLALAITLSLPAAAQMVSRTTAVSIGGANALSTPAGRHVVRFDPGGSIPPTYLMAIQRDGTLPNPGLSFYRSDDDGVTWYFYNAINPSSSERDTTDLLKVGNDIALVYSYDGPSLVPNATLDPQHKVYFQWWRYAGLGTWNAQPAVLVFDPGVSGSAYHRGELAIDSLGRIWVQAWRRDALCSGTACALCSVPNGDNYNNTAVVAASTDNGVTFSAPQALASTLCRGGGRFSSLGTKLLMLWNDHSGNGNGTVVGTNFRIHNDADPITLWGPTTNAFPDIPADGVFHGAALSSVVSNGSLHLVYKDQNNANLWYRKFDGASMGFGPRTQLDNSHDDWALQAATSIFNNKVYVVDNHLINSELVPWPSPMNLNNYEMRLRLIDLVTGTVSFSTTLDSLGMFRGYPSAPETVPATVPVPAIPFVFGQTPDSASAGSAISLRVRFDSFSTLEPMFGLTDAFTTVGAPDPAKWSVSGASATSGNGLLTLNVATAGGGVFVTSSSLRDMTGSVASTKVPSGVTGPGINNKFSIQAPPPNDNSYDCGWWLEGGLLSPFYDVNGVQVSAGVSLTYSSATHAYWRIREANGTVYWDTSADGTNWTNAATAATSALGTIAGQTLPWVYNGANLVFDVKSFGGTGQATYSNLNQ